MLKTLGSFALSILILAGANSPSLARVCDTGPAQLIQQRSIGETINVRQKMKINSVCTRSLGSGGRKAQWAMLSLEFVEYPKTVFKLVANAYSFAFQASRTGSYQIHYRYKVRSNFNGREGYINYIMNVDVVPSSW